MTARSLSFLTAALLLALPTLSFSEGRTVKLLTIGNSFSNNATNYLKDLADGGGQTLIHYPITVGGASLELHATKAQKYEADPNDPEGRYANGRSLKEALLSDRWDYVTIQQASIKSHDLSTYHPYADWLADYIAKHAPSAKLLVHQTWAYRVDDSRFTTPSNTEGAPATQAEMYQGLNKAYRSIARDFSAGLLPVGDAFFLADTDPNWGYQPDPNFKPSALVYPEAPAQKHSLHVGWRWRKVKDSDRFQLAMDGHHAGPAGQYLGACVWYETLFGESTIGHSFIPVGIEPDYARFLQETAHRAVTAVNAQEAQAKP